VNAAAPDTSAPSRIEERRASGAGRSARELLRGAFAPVDIASLACFRVAFGAVMVWEVYRYFTKGWIASYYIRPEFYFTYYGFGWVRPWPGEGMYVHFAVMGLAALCVTLGLFYRASAAVFFFAFTYVFLLDQTRYLNHFYLISLIAFLMIFLPVHRALSLDARRRPELRSDTAPALALWLVRAQVGIPYFYGGLAKLNGDWLRGEPIRSWLAARTDFPLIGRHFTEEWMVYSFAYGGVLLDLLIVPLLLWRRSRPYAFAVGVLFHATNAVLFRIGIFPWMMMAATTIFFRPDWPRRLGLLPGPRHHPAVAGRERLSDATLPRGYPLALAATWILVQALFPLRHFLYPGNVSWTEEGHRFAWHMKLRDKDAYARFEVTDSAAGRTWTVSPRRYLTRTQASKMAGQPDMILQFAHRLAAEARLAGESGVQVRARVTAALNGRDPQLLVDPEVDLAAQPRSLRHASWIVPLHQPLPWRSPPHEQPDADE
jgi:vitamin K-dependent gamma-carboxylase-like protein